ncbi:cobalt transporter CbiM [Clostridium sardiniense]|uniref:cobalt transporter CbiM n=1 Tax=Clostridium sardiniense TaxID=29369 RepID=UPI003D33634C
MHIPENYLSPSTCAVMGAVMIPVWKHSISKVRRDLSKKKIPMLGVCAAFSFLLMMFNVPAPGGTSAHAVGSVLIAIMLGPASATIAASIALLIQCLFFGDGGILAYGANAFNMAFIMPVVGYYTYTFLKSKIKSDKGEYVAAFVGSYLGLNIAALCAAIEFGIQPLLFKNSLGQPLYCPYPLSVSIPAMVSTHLLIGLLEGAVTVGVYAYIKKVSPATIHDGGQENISSVFKGSIVAIVVMIILTPLGLIASGTAWGEWGADEVKDLIGYIPNGMNSGFSYHALGDGYGFSGLGPVAGYILSAVIGVASLIILFKVIASLKKE